MSTSMCVIVVANVSESRGRYTVLGSLVEVYSRLEAASSMNLGFVILEDADDTPFILALSQIESVYELRFTPVKETP